MQRRKGDIYTAYNERLGQGGTGREEIILLG